MNYLTATFVLLILFFSACSDGKRDIHDYYFPVKALRNGQVYAYQSEEGDTTERRYWYYRSFERDSGLFMAGVQYSRNFEIVQRLWEKIVDNGSLARTIFLYETDPATGLQRPIPTQVESPNLFPFRVTDSIGIFLFQVKYHPVEDTAATIYVIRNRRYLGAGPDFELDGKKYSTVRFDLHEAVGNDKLGASEVEGVGEEWYAEGLGLVYYSKSFANGRFRNAFRLIEQFSKKELDRRAGPALREQ